MLMQITHTVSVLRYKAHHMEDFENFLLMLTIGLFALLFVRSLVALYMGRWNLFPDI